MMSLPATGGAMLRMMLALAVVLTAWGLMIWYALQG